MQLSSFMMAEQQSERKSGKKPKFTPADTDENIAHPYLELYRHTAMRGANTGSLIPLMFAPPILYFRGVRNPREILYRTAKASMYGVVVGSVATVIMTYMMTRNDEEVMVWDRSYRLRHNKGQCHLDKVTYGVTGTGALAGAVTASTMRGTGAILGGSLGFGLSVLVHMISKGKD